jgi:hypothetical protein
MRKNFIITESERKNILRMYGLISEQTPVQTTTGSTQHQIPSDFEKILVSLPDNSEYPYTKVTYYKNILTGHFYEDKRPDPNTFKEVITPNNKFYKKLMDYVYEQYNIKVKEKGEDEKLKMNTKLIDGYGRTGEPRKVDIQNLTTEDLNIIFKYSKEYQTAHDNHMKTNKGNFCAGDLWDISMYTPNPNGGVEKVRNCGAPSYDPVPMSKVKTNKSHIIDMIYFMIKNPSDQRAIDLKKRLGINEQPATQSSGNLMQHKIYNPENEQ